MYLRNRQFKEIEGMRFDEDDEPLYQISFAGKGKDSRQVDQLKCTT